MPRDTATLIKTRSRLHDLAFLAKQEGDQDLVQKINMAISEIEDCIHAALDPSLVV